MKALIGTKEYDIKSASVNYQQGNCNIDLRMSDDVTPLDEMSSDITANFNGTVTISGTVYNVANFSGINRYYSEMDINTNAYFNNQVQPNFESEVEEFEEVE